MALDVAEQIAPCLFPDCSSALTDQLHVEIWKNPSMGASPQQLPVRLMEGRVDDVLAGGSVGSSRRTTIRGPSAFPPEPQRLHVLALIGRTAAPRVRRLLDIVHEELTTETAWPGPDAPSRA